MFAKIQRIHFVGVGGIGMSGIAEVLLNLGYKISGSDLKQSAVTDRLKVLGAIVSEGHSAENVVGAEVVVTSSAINAGNPEVEEARRLHVPVIQRAEMLAELMRLKYGIAIAGMHGKTTTTSMVAAVLAASGLDPTVVVGGRVDAMGSNARLGNSQYMVAEADESDRSFLKLSPILAVVTNIDREHMDCYRNMRDVKRAFLDFMDRVPFYGMVVLCNDDPILRRLLPQIPRRVVTYGTRRGSDFHIKVRECGFDNQNNHPISRFDVIYRGTNLGDFRLRVPGAHNVLNATAAIAVGIGLDIQVGQIRVIFQPHRYTRTRDLMDDFATAFEDADSLIVLDVYPASEQPIEGVTGEALVQKIIEAGKSSATYASSFAEAAKSVCEVATEGDMILTLGAGGVSQLGPMILEKLQGSENTVITQPVSQV